MIHALKPLLVLFILGTSALNFAENQDNNKLRVAFVNPMPATQPFWREMSGFIKAAAKSLDIELSVYHADGSSHRATQITRELLSGERPPEYMIHIYAVGHGHRVMQLTNQAGVKTFTVNSDIIQNEKARINKPRKHFKHWLGHMFPDYKNAGYELGKFLIQEAHARKQIAADGKAHILALAGENNSPAATERLEGLRTAVKESKMAVIDQAIFTGWLRDESRYKTCVLLERHKDISVIWTVSDLIALGALDCIANRKQDISKQTGASKGKHYLVGGIDGIPEAFNSMNNGALTATLSSHFMESAWALVMLYDYFHGHDFIEKNGTVMRSKIQLINRQNAEKFIPLLTEKGWQTIDFTHFSKHHNPEIKQYDFSLDNVFEASL